MADTAKTTRKTGGTPAAGSGAGHAVAFPAGVPGGPAAHKVWGVLLGADAVMTATAITVAAGVARGTVSTTLNALERAGAVLRIPGEGKAGAPDLWLVAGGVREGAGIAQPAAASAPVIEADVYMPAEHTPVLDALAVDAAHVCSVSGRPKRVRGQLEAEVLSVLIAQYPAEFGATALSRMLDGASSGAIANALEKLRGLGKAMLTCQAPKRYRAIDPPAAVEAEAVAV